jgi:hypothetical protein
MPPRNVSGEPAYVTELTLDGPRTEVPTTRSRFVPEVVWLQVREELVEAPVVALAAESKAT